MDKQLESRAFMQELIDELGVNISTRLINAFGKHGINSREQFLSLTAYELKRWPSVGEKLAQEFIKLRMTYLNRVGEKRVSNQKQQPRRAIALTGTDLVLELSKATAVNTEKRMIHLDELPDGTWRLIYNGKMIPDFSAITALTIIREDEPKA